VNEIQLAPGLWWKFAPALESLRELWRAIISAIPVVAFSILILSLTWFAGGFAARGMRAWFGRRLTSPLLCAIAGRAAHAVVALIGLYVVLQVAGLTNVAFTIVGGTGLLGLILGIAFRDITENFLASMFLAFQQPFRNGDLIEIDGFVGLVQRLTARSTTLMALDGNHVQIPNATVYKSIIRNYTSNPYRRDDFTIGIGFDDAISRAQEVAMTVLSQHPAVLKNPEPWVLVDNLGKATVNLRVYFWLDGTSHSWLKVRSSVIRLIKRAFQNADISMPDEAREVVFPKGVPIVNPRDYPLPPSESVSEQSADESDLLAQPSEGELSSEDTAFAKQAAAARAPEEGRNLLAGAP